MLKEEVLKELGWMRRQAATQKLRWWGSCLQKKSGHADGIAQTLGKIWCPIKGIKCRELGNNFFLITFLQQEGKRRALEEEFGGDLFLVREFDGKSRLDELEFFHTPCWVRVFKLPLGMMNKITGEAIGDNIGSTLEVDAEDDELAVGLFLRVKVLLDVRKPLMRGVTVEVNKEGEKIWCPLEYEFLPNFCYICGLLGHTDKSCNAGGWRVKKKPFSSELRVIPSRRRFQEEGRGRSKEGNGLGGSKWERSQGSGSRQDWRDTKRSGSDSVKFSNGSEKGEASTSPIKMLEQGGNEEAAQKLFFGGEAVVAL